VEAAKKSPQSDSAVVAQMNLTIIPYAEARDSIQNGNLLFWRPTNVVGRLIAAATHSPYSHVASCSWAHGVLESHDMLQWQGGWTRNLSSWAKTYPGDIDVYSVPGAIDVEPFVGFQRRRSGNAYNWLDLIHCAESTIHTTLLPGYGIKLADAVPGSRLWCELWMVPVDRNVFCSQGVVSDLRRANCEAVRPLWSLAAWEINPGMLAGLMTYRFTLGE
jgi:hypothetical protein